jgi:hypothetical protein
MSEVSTFLPDSDIERITEIRRGNGSKNKYQLQCEVLRSMSIPFTTSRLGRPLVPRSVYEKTPAVKPPVWRPNVLSAAQ